MAPLWSSAPQRTLVRRACVDGGERGGTRRRPLLDQELDQSNHEDQLAVLHPLGLGLDVLDLVPEVEQVRRVLLHRMGALAVLARGREMFGIASGMCHPNPPFERSLGPQGIANPRARLSICAKTHK